MNSRARRLIRNKSILTIAECKHGRSAISDGAQESGGRSDGTQESIAADRTVRRRVAAVRTGNRRSRLKAD